MTTDENPMMIWEENASVFLLKTFFFLFGFFIFCFSAFFFPGNDVSIDSFYSAKNHRWFRGGHVKLWIKKNQGICHEIFPV